MIILLFFSFISGLLTILTPCIWPILPVVLSSSAGGGRGKPLGVSLGVVSSFSILTLSISYLIRVIPFDPEILRFIAAFVIAFLGFSLAVPFMSRILESFVSRLTSKFGGSTLKSGGGFSGGFVTGFSLGVVWSPCAGPILATVAALASTQMLNLSTILVLISFSLGVGLPLFAFATFGNKVLARSRFLSKYTGTIQRVFGVVMILAALGIYKGYDRVLQAKILDLFPSYSTFLVGIEDNELVRRELDKLTGNGEDKKMEEKKKSFARAPELVGINNWLNTDAPLKLSDLRGKVVLLDFWTYTCINCIRTLPHVTSWYEKYKDRGFVVVGVHTPEFEFEKKTENVLNAIRQHGITYPVAQDNDYKTWRAYNNRYWPAEYLIDSDGFIRRTHFGEGDYEESEEAIRKLLSEIGGELPTSGSAPEDKTPIVRNTPETYLGLARAQGLKSNEKAVLGLNNFSRVSNLEADSFSLEGEWNLQDEFAAPKAGSALNLNFSAVKVFLVISSVVSDETSVRIFVDGEAIPAAISGKDVENGVLKVNSDGLYELIDLNSSRGRHGLRLEFDGGDILLHAFTFE